MRTVMCSAALVAAIMLPVRAAPTTADQAAKAVQGWLTVTTHPLDAALGSGSGNVETFADGQGRPLYYIVHTQPSGFVIVPGDDLVEPIIGFAPAGNYDPSEDNPLGALVSRDMACRVAAARAGQAAAPRALPSGQAADPKAKWLRFQGLTGSMAPALTQAASISDVRVAPLVLSTWSQMVAGDIPGAPACYNYYTPPGPNGSTTNYPCGCVATAMAQLMRFYQYPTVGIGRQSFTYYIQGVASSGFTLGGDGAGGAYNWSLMPLSPNASTPLNQCQQIGALCWDAGIAVGMDYSPGGSGATATAMKAAMKSPFGYANAINGGNAIVNIGAGLIGMLNPNLDAGRPALLGIRGTGGGHAVVGDGYGYDSGTLYHHLNLGWSGMDTAWYNLPTIDTSGPLFDIVGSCVYNVFTAGVGEIISGRITDAGGSPMAGVTVTAQASGAGSYSATTNSKGIYALCPVPPNTSFVLAASASGYIFTSQSATTGTSSDLGSTSGNCWGVDFTGGPAIPTLSVTPGTGLTSTGFVGGAFSPSSVTYTLQNTGVGSVNWTAAKGQAWVTLSKIGGTLSAGEIDTVMVSINNNANGLPVGAYSDTVTVTNTTNGNGDATRAVSLTVNRPPTLTVTPGTGLTSSGWQGGPFNPASEVYTLQNIGIGNLTWVADKGQIWVTLSKLGGTLSAGQTDTVTATINTDARSLGVGVYDDTITLTNLTNGNGNGTYPVGLTVTPIPVKPVIPAISDASVQEPNPYVGPAPSLAQGALPVTWSLLAGPKGMTIDSGTGAVSWPASSTTESPCIITIKAANGLGSGTQTWCLKVKPFITYMLSVQTNSGSQASINVTDPNGQTIPVLTDFSERYGAGSFVTITAPQALGGESFVKWMLDGSQYSVGMTVTVQMNGPHSLEAVYDAAAPQPITSKCGAAGSENLPILGMMYFLALMLARRFVAARR
jgi:hypothetical protein